MENFKINLKTNIQALRHILIIEEANFKRTVSLTEASYSIGRQSSNDIVLSLPKVSRHHATFLRRTDVKTNNYSYWVLDGDLQGNRSRNGIFINNKRCLVHELKSGDTIKFGDEVTASYQVIATSDLSTEEAAFLPNQINNNKVGLIDKKTIFNKETIIYPEQPDSCSNNNELIRLASFAELSNQFIFEIDLQGTITYLNFAANKEFSELKQNDSTHPFLANLSEQCNQKKYKITREVSLNERYFEQTAHYLPENKIIRSYVVELTKEKKLEEKLQQQEKILYTLLQQIQIGFLLVDGVTKKIVDSNDVIYKLVNYSREELCQLTIDRLSSNQDLETNLQLILENKISFTQTIELCKKDNSTVNVEMKINLVGTETQPQFLLILRPLEQQFIGLPQEQITSLSNLFFFNNN
jgi:pSer/pThr/pTyr-binding forkhead associated (FHA) protein